MLLCSSEILDCHFLLCVFIWVGGTIQALQIEPDSDLFCHTKSLAELSALAPSSLKLSHYKSKVGGEESMQAEAKEKKDEEEAKLACVPMKTEEQK